MIMSFIRTPSTAIPRSQLRLCARDDLLSFVDQNADDLLWVSGAAGGHNGRAAAAALVDAVLSDPDDVETIHDLVVVLRDALLAGSVPAGPAGSCGRPDLDAALRWFGARLDEFAVRFS